MGHPFQGFISQKKGAGAETGTEKCKPKPKKTSYYSTGQTIGIFWQILKKWRGSVYKLLYAELLLYMFLYYVIMLIYKFALFGKGQNYFEDIVKYCKKGSDLPISFVLGFFVSTIMNRWWNQWNSIPRPTALAVLLSATLKGGDEIGIALRRTIIRYVNCSITMVMSQLSESVKKRFPTNQHLVTAGLLNTNEELMLKDISDANPGTSQWVIPIIWATTIASKAREIGRISDDYACKGIIDELISIRGKAGTLLGFASQNISLVYCQVVTIACYSYFVAALFGSQAIVDKEDKYINFAYFPIFLALKYLFFMGWLKVAEENINPFGDDEDDFDVSSIIDSNLQSSYLIVDKLFHQFPAILKDLYWGEVPGVLKDKELDSKPGTPENCLHPEKHDGKNDEDSEEEDRISMSSRHSCISQIIPAMIDMPVEMMGTVQVDTQDDYDAITKYLGPEMSKDKVKVRGSVDLGEFPSIVVENKPYSRTNSRLSTKF